MRSAIRTLLVTGLVAVTAVHRRRPGPTAAAGRRRAARAAGLPHRDQLRQRGRDRLGQERRERRRSEAERLRGHRGRQAADGRKLQVPQARRRRDAGPGRSAPGHPHRRRRRGRGGSRRRPPVRDLPRRLPRAPARQHGRARPALEVRRTAARAVRHDRPDVSAAVRPQPADDAQPRRHHPGHPEVHRPEVRLHADERHRAAVRQLPGRDGRADPGQGVALGAQGPDHPHGHAQAGAEVADRRQRRVHLHGAAAAAQPELADAGHRPAPARGADPITESRA